MRFYPLWKLANCVLFWAQSNFPVFEGGPCLRLAKPESRLALKARVEVQGVMAPLISTKSDLAEIWQGRGGSVFFFKQPSALFGSVPSITSG